MRTAKVVGLEALIVIVVGLALAFLANAVSPRGLRLGRNYFPGPEPAPETVKRAKDASAGPAPAVSSNAAVANGAEGRLARRGFRPATREQVLAWFRDSAYAQGLTVFVDARNDAHYTAGHIPNAWQFDHYRAENYLPAVLPVCLTAMRVVVYCGGGECEDSEFAAVMLRDAGVAAENLFVYVGGIADWKSHGLPVETGARGSGQVTKAKP